MIPKFSYYGGDIHRNILFLMLPSLHMTIPSHAQIVRWLTIATCCTPLLFAPFVLTPFQAPTFLAFSALVAITLPFYLSWIKQERSLFPDKGNPLLLAVIFYLGIRLISAVFGVDPWNSFFGNEARIGGLILQLHLFLFTLYLFALLKFDREKFFRSVSTTFILLASIASLHGILEYLNILTPLSAGFESRSSSVFGNPAFFASFLVIPLFLAIARSLSETSKKYKRLFQGATVLTFLAILTTGTRGAFLAIIIGILLTITLRVVFTSTTKTRRRLILSALVFLILLTGSFGIARTIAQPDTELYRFTHLFTDTGVERFAYWNMSWKGWKEHPILGNGYENFYQTSTSHFDPALYEFSNFWIDKPHNAFFEILSTGGLLSLVSYLTLIGLMLYALRQSIRKENDSWTPLLLIGAVIAYLVQAFFLFDLLDSQIPFAFLLAYTVLLFEKDRAPTGAIPLSKKALPILILGGVGTVALIVFFYAPMLHDLFYAMESQDAVKHKNWELALEDTAKIGTSWMAFDHHLTARNRYDLLQQAIDANVRNASFYTELFHLTYEAQERAIARHPQHMEYLNERIGTLIFEARLKAKPVSDEAFTLAQRSIALAPNRIESLFLLSQVYQQNNEWESAIDTIEQAVRIAPSNALAMGTLGMLYFQTGEKEQGALYLRRALEKDFQFLPSYVTVVSLLSNYYAEIGDWESNIALFTLAIERLPYDFDLYTTLATSYHMAGDDEGARRIAEQLLAIDPSTEEGVRAFLETLDTQEEVY